MQKLFTAFLFLVATVLLSCKGGNNPHPLVVVETSYGDIVMELYPDKAPKTAGNFLRYVDAGVYERSNFYRILSTDNQPMGTNAAELIQGGLWANKAAKDTFPPTPHETTQQTGLKHLHGTVSLARQEPGTGSTEFFICIGDQPGFDYGGENNADGQGYAAFGKVIEGMEVVQKIYRQPEENQFFNPPIPIINIKRK